MNADTGTDGCTMVHWADRVGVGTIDLAGGRGHIEHAVTDSGRAVAHTTVSLICKVCMWCSLVLSQQHPHFSQCLVAKDLDATAISIGHLHATNAAWQAL